MQAYYLIYEQNEVAVLSETYLPTEQWVIRQQTALNVHAETARRLHAVRPHTASGLLRPVGRHDNQIPPGVCAQS